MFWADRICDQVKGYLHIDDMFTPSGFAHVGSLRGPVLHDVVYRALLEKKKKAIFTYVFNDFDPIDGLPQELEKDFSKYLGFPLRLAPSPDGKSRSFADYFADDFKKVLSQLAVKPQFLSSWDMYHEGKFNEAIRVALDNAEKIQNIYKRVSGSRKKEIGWYPLQVICPQCQKLGTTKVTGWDGKKVRFICEENLVVWAKGCGFKGEISPFDGNGKLPWKVDWPAHWKVLGVTFEGAGKDHASRGGSYDIAFALCEEVFNHPKPYYFPYEFFLLGGKKMASSKGIGLKARDLTKILPPEVARFLIVRVIPQKAIEFDPQGTTIIDLFDEFDRCAKAYWEKSNEDFARIFQLSFVNDWYREKVFLPRLREVASYLQMPNVDIYTKFSEIKGGKLNILEGKILNQRIKYAKIWLERFAPEQFKFTVEKKLPAVVQNLSQKQKDYLTALSQKINTKITASDLQNELFILAQKLKISPSDAFAAIYLSLLGKTHGPKAAWLITSLSAEFVKKRFQETVKN